MDRTSTDKLRLDRRLIGRRNWVSKDELERALEALPDASDKIADTEESEDGAAAAANAPPAGEPQASES